jgi:hypothetical protein
VWLAELCLGSWPTVTRETRLTRTCYGGYESSLSINPADDMRISFDHKQIAVWIETDLVRSRERGVQRWSTIADVSFLTVACNRSQAFRA